ncbi:transposase family protein, partial [Acidithiobacillus sp. RW2]|nr:transposase family protein [Acidithiobacillus sulfurivorans]
LFPLHPQARLWLAQPQPQLEWTHTPMQTVTLSDAQMEGLRQIFFHLPDTRSKLGKQHPLPAILTVAVAAVLTQAESYAAIAEWASRLTQAQLKRIRARFNPRTQRYVPRSGAPAQRVPAWTGGHHRAKGNRPENQRNSRTAQPALGCRHHGQGRHCRCPANPAGDRPLPRRRQKSRLSLYRRQRQSTQTPRPSDVPPLGRFFPSALKPQRSDMAALNIAKSSSP